MSWDVFVQDIPPHAASLDDIPDDFEPQPLGPRSRIVAAIVRIAPFADVSDPSWLRIDGHGVDLEVSLGDDDPVEEFAFHVRGGDASAGFIAAVLKELGLRAIDGESETGLFDERTAAASLERWKSFRDAATRG